MGVLGIRGGCIGRGLTDNSVGRISEAPSGSVPYSAGWRFAYPAYNGEHSILSNPRTHGFYGVNYRNNANNHISTSRLSLPSCLSSPIRYVDF